MIFLRICSIPFAIFGLFISSTASLLSETESGEEFRLGSKSKNTIQIYITGDVTHPGKYHVPKGTGLKSVLGRAGGFTWYTEHTIPKTGRLEGIVSLVRRGKLTKYSIARLQLAHVEDVELESDDSIYFSYIPFISSHLPDGEKESNKAEMATPNQPSD